MRRLFGGPATPGEEKLEAYREGRADERSRLGDPVIARDDRAALAEAYDRGRREERLRHRGSPLLAFVTLVLVVIALAVLVLAVRAGSFAGAGRQIDALLQRPVHSVADKAGSALQDAGRTIKDKAGSGPS